MPKWKWLQKTASFLDKTLFDAGDIVAKAKYPTYKKYYHGSRNPIDIHNLQKSTVRNIGLHMSDDPKVAATFAGFGDLAHYGTGKVYKFYAPKPTLETIDIGRNDVNMLMGKLNFEPSSTTGYSATKNSDLLFDAIKKAGGEDVLEILPYDTSYLYDYNPLKMDYSGAVNFRVKRPVTLNLEDVVWPNKPTAAKERLSRIWEPLPEHSFLNGYVVGKYPEEVGGVPANDLAADVLSDFGHKVVKYENKIPSEGPKTAYILTDPKSMYLPPELPFKVKHALGAGLGVGVGIGTYNILNEKSQ